MREHHVRKMGRVRPRGPAFGPRRKVSMSGKNKFGGNSLTRRNHLN